MRFHHVGYGAYHIGIQAASHPLLSRQISQLVTGVWLGVELLRLRSCWRERGVLLPDFLASLGLAGLELRGAFSVVGAGPFETKYPRNKTTILWCLFGGVWGQAGHHGPTPTALVAHHVPLRERGTPCRSLAVGCSATISPYYTKMYYNTPIIYHNVL